MIDQIPYCMQFLVPVSNIVNWIAEADPLRFIRNIFAPDVPVALHESYSQKNVYGKNAKRKKK